MNEGNSLNNNEKKVSNGFNERKFIMLKIILLLFLFLFRQTIFNNKQNIEKLTYKSLNINKYKKTIKLTEGGLLEVFENNDKTNQIETKHGKIYKSEILYLSIPGGAYEYVSKREGPPIAKKFFSFGYSSAVLIYSVYPHSYPTCYEQGLQAIKILSSKFKKIILIGFSAGGHLAGLLGTTKRNKIYNVIGMVLCYPVISFYQKFHKKSRDYFFGNKVKNNKKNQKLFSIEYRVNSDTVPTFIWTVKKDKVVPYENTLYMIEKLKKYKILFESKIYEEGRHGIALADRSSIYKGNKEYYNKEIAKWPILASNFFEKLIKNK